MVFQWELFDHFGAFLRRNAPHTVTPTRGTRGARRLPPERGGGAPRPFVPRRNPRPPLRPPEGNGPLPYPGVPRPHSPPRPPNGSKGPVRPVERGGGGGRPRVDSRPFPSIPGAGAPLRPPAPHSPSRAAAPLLEPAALPVFSRLRTSPPGTLAPLHLRTGRPPCPPLRVCPGLPSHCPFFCRDDTGTRGVPCFWSPFVPQMSVTCG